MYVSASFLIVLLFFVFVATVCRYLSIPWVTWSEELSRNLMVWLALLGAGTVAREGNHFSVDALYRIFPDPIKRCFFVVIQLAYWAFGAFITYYGVSNCLKVRAMNQKLSFRSRGWPKQKRSGLWPLKNILADLPNLSRRWVMI